MGNRIAVIINGDTESRHLTNVERARTLLASKGYQTYVASTAKPSGPTDYYVEATPKGVQDLIQALKQKLTKEDELVIYTTGHGEAEGLCVGDKCNSRDLFVQLDQLAHHQRVVVMDQCLGGNFGKLFLDDPRTLFISAGSKHETVCCGEFAPRMFAPDLEVPDDNKDGVITWQDRFVYTRGPVRNSSPRLVASMDYKMEGRASFKAEVVQVQAETDLATQLKQLRPGQFAVINFSADWCSPCKLFKPQFETLAKGDQGQHLWMWTENEDLAKKYVVQNFPTSIIIDAFGNTNGVSDRNAIPQALAQFEPDVVQQLENRWAQARRSGNLATCVKDGCEVACALAKEGFRDRALVIFEEVVSNVNDPKGNITLNERASHLTVVGKALFLSGFQKRGEEVFESVSSVANHVSNPLDKTDRLTSLALSLDRVGLQRMKGKVLQEFFRHIDSMPRVSSRMTSLERMMSWCPRGSDLVRTVFQKYVSVISDEKDPAKRVRYYLDVADHALRYFTYEEGRARAVEVVDLASQQARKVEDPAERQSLLQGLAGFLQANKLTQPPYNPQN